MKTIVAFDDSVSEIVRCIRLLHRYNAKATFFLDVHRINPCMLEALSGIPACCEIASHSLTHRRLDKLSEHDLRSEIFESKRTLENITKRKVITFAYPYGIHDRRAAEYLQKAGYAFARTTETFSLGIDFKNRYRLGVLMTDCYPSYREIFKHVLSENLRRLSLKVLDSKIQGTNPYLMMKQFITEVTESLRSTGELEEVMILVFHPRKVEEHNAWSVLEEIINELTSAARLLTFQDVLIELNHGCH